MPGSIRISTCPKSPLCLEKVQQFWGSVDPPKEIGLSNPLLLPISSASLAPPILPLLTICQCPLATLHPKLALQRFFRPTGTKSCPGFSFSAPSPPAHHLCPCPRLHVQKSTGVQKKGSAQRKGGCKNTEISSLRIRVRGFAYYY